MQRGQGIAHVVTHFNADNGAMVDAFVLLHAYCAHMLYFAAECARYAPYPAALPQFDSINIVFSNSKGEGRTTFV